MEEDPYFMVKVRDMNLLCQHFKTYAGIEGYLTIQYINLVPHIDSSTTAQTVCYLV